MFKRRAAALLTTAMVVVAACSGNPATSKPATPAAASGAPDSRAAGQCIVGVSWNNFQQPRWAAKDQPSMKRVVTDGGGLFLDFDANLSNTQQLTDVQTLINQGAKVIVLL